MPRTTITATTQFHEMGLTDEAQWTDTMNLAVRQKWNHLPVTTPVDTLRKQLAAVVLEQTPTAAMLAAGGHAGGDPEACKAEAARLKRNAAVNHWRARGQLQAALDARGLVFAGRRAKGKAAAAA